jgi:uncharacterized membrane protein required for colicin V production
LILASFTPLTRDPWWSESPLIQRLLPLSEWATGLMPETLQELIYDEPDTAEAGDAA